MLDSKKVRIVTLGCAKNEVDSEEIAGVLTDSGFSIDALTKILRSRSLTRADSSNPARKSPSKPLSRRSGPNNRATRGK